MRGRRKRSWNSRDFVRGTATQRARRVRRRTRPHGAPGGRRGQVGGSLGGRGGGGGAGKAARRVRAEGGGLGGVLWETAWAGSRFVPPGVRRAGPAAGLSPRERQIASLVAQGLP